MRQQEAEEDSIQESGYDEYSKDIRARSNGRQRTINCIPTKKKIKKEQLIAHRTLLLHTGMRHRL
jgi:hypothetical protein